MTTWLSQLPFCAVLEWKSSLLVWGGLSISHSSDKWRENDAVLYSFPALELYSQWPRQLNSRLVEVRTELLHLVN